MKKNDTTLQKMKFENTFRKLKFSDLQIQNDDVETDDGTTYYIHKLSGVVFGWGDFDEDDDCDDNCEDRWRQCSENEKQRLILNGISFCKKN